MSQKIQPFYEQQITCPVCQNKFTTTRVRSSACVVIKRESDFNIIYKDINPLLYSIYVCPKCQYAAPDKVFNKELTPVEKQRLIKSLDLLKKEEPDFSGQRTPELAIRAIELAIRTYQITRSGPGIMAGLYLRGAWLYRQLKDKEKELQYLEQARKLYLDCYENEPPNPSRMSEVRLMYLIGELHNRVGLYQDAVKWFSRVVSDPNVKKEPDIERLARDQWDYAKQEYKKQQADGDINTVGQMVKKNNQITEDDAKEDGNNKTVTLNIPVQTEKVIPAKEKTSIKVSLYKEQIIWLQNMAKKSSDPDGTLGREEIIRAILDAVIEADFHFENYKNENELKNLLYSQIRDRKDSKLAVPKTG